MAAMLSLQAILEPAWPALAWLAECRAGVHAITVRHGPHVEARDTWLCEAVWDGEFECGDFDRTASFFGSGVRVRQHQAVFVSSASTVDRLCVLRRGSTVLISNSLACLLARSDTSVDPTYDRWFQFFVSIKDGIDAFQRHVPMLEPVDVQLTYFRNLVWDGESISETNKPDTAENFETFSAYYSFLDRTVGRLAANMTSTSRRTPRQFLGTLSSGYDAATAVTICRKHGLSAAVASAQPRGAEDSDDGSAVAETLGIELSIMSRDAWRSQSKMPEIEFFAANPRGGEVYLRGAERHLRGKVLVTGFHGDKVWGKQTTALGPNIVRGDMSGLSLTEYRLEADFIHFPLAFLGVRQIRDINRLGNSDEMAPWDVGGHYSRPICRRIIEESGVPRDMFGQRKKMASVHFGQGEAVLTDRSREDYYTWLKSVAPIFSARGLRAPRPPGRLTVSVRRHHYRTAGLARGLARPLPASARRWLDNRVASWQWFLNRRINLPDFVFAWAMQRVVERYRQAT